MQRVFTRFVVKTIGDQGDTATFFAIKQTHAYIHRVHHSDKVFAELRMVIVNVATMEISDLSLVERLAGTVLFKPAAEGAVRIFGQGFMVMHANGFVHQLFHQWQRGCGVDEWRKRRGDRAK